MLIWERNWTMNVGALGLRQAKFCLERRAADGIIYYKLKLKSCGNIEAWADVDLIRRGLILAPWNQPPLHPYDPANPNAYDQPIADWLQSTRSVTLRLEGELKLARVAADDREAIVSPIRVTFLLAKNAVKFDVNKFRDLLVVHYTSATFAGSVTGSPEGTGHGDPDPT